MASTIIAISTLILAPLISVSFPNNAQAKGIIPFITSTFAAGKSAPKTTYPEGQNNSQNMEILSALLSPKLAVGGGDIVIVDNNAIEYQAEASTENYQTDQISVYVVREGDTLSQIAAMYNVSVNTIVFANDIAGGVITPGQNLVILPISGVKHIVKTGDTLQSIAKEHSGDIKEILQYNDLPENAKLAVGDEIIIPNGEAIAVVKTSTSGSKANARPDLGGYFMKPLANYRKTQGVHGFNGVDLAAPLGSSIVAAASGKVIISRNSGWNGGYGNYVVISHPNGTQTLYAHMTKTVAIEGTTVSQGQLIGYLGSTGKSTGPHLHFEVRGAKNPF